MNCPVDIDTGKLIKQLRFDQNSTLENSIANWCESNFALASKLARLGLAAANITRKVVGRCTCWIEPHYSKSKWKSNSSMESAFPKACSKYRLEI